MPSYRTIKDIVRRYPALTSLARLAIRIFRSLKYRSRAWIRVRPRVAQPVRKLFLILGLSGRASFLTQANMLANAGRHREAVSVLETGLRRYPHHMQAHETLIQVLVYLQLYERALNACVRALEIDAKSNTLRDSLTVILSTLRSTQQPEENIIQSLNRCVAIIPQNFEVVVLLLEMLVKLKRYREAVQACELALKLDPEFLPAIEILEKLEKDPAAQSELAGLPIADIIRISDDYRRLVAENVADFLSLVLGTLYRKMGTAPEDAPLVQGLARFRRKFQRSHDDIYASPTATLIPFEKAWSLYQAGKTGESLPLFEAIFRDSEARRKAAYNPYVKVAVLRSGEILGRYHDTHGDVDLAIATFREIVSMDQNNMIAGRLLVLLARQGDLRAAAELAEGAIVSRPNLYPRLLDSAYIASLKEEIAHN